MPCSAVSQLTNAPAPPVPSSWPTTPAQQSVFLQQLANMFAYARDAAGRQGVNVVPTAYAVYNGAQLPTLTVSGATAALDTTRHQFGLASLKLTATGATVSVAFPSGAVPISSFQRWIASTYLFTSRTSIAGTLSIITGNGTYSATINSSTGLSEWYRLWGDMSLVGDAATSCTLQLTFTGCSVGDTFNLEGWQLEAASGNTNLPTPFANTGAPSSVDALPDGTNYVRIAASNVSGNIAYNFKGAWQSSANYIIGDEVSYSGGYWLAVAPSSSSAPSLSNANWQAVGTSTGFTQALWKNTTTGTAALGVSPVSLLPGVGTGSRIIPANTLGVGAQLRCIIRGFVSVAPTASSSVFPQIVLGSSIIGSSTTGSGVINTTSLGYSFTAEATLTCLTTGSSGTCAGAFFGVVGGNSSALAQVPSTWADSFKGGIIALDTTVNNTWDVRMSVGGACSLLLTNASLEQL